MQSMFLIGRWLSGFAIITLALSCQSPSPTVVPTPTAVPNVLETPPTRVPAGPTPVSPLLSTPDRLPSDTSSSPLARPTRDQTGWTIYRGTNPYRLEYPQYEIRYDPKIWSLDTVQSTYSLLIHQEIPNCRLVLDAGPIGAQQFATVQLAGREWSVATVQKSSLLYGTPYQNIAFIFGVRLPEEFSPTSKSRCQIEAEMVIDTFTVVEK